MSFSLFPRRLRALFRAYPLRTMAIWLALIMTVFLTRGRWEAWVIGPALVGHEHYVVCAAFSGDDTLIATGSWDRTVRVWETDTARCVAVLQACDRVRCVAFSPDGQHVAAGGDGRTIRIWRVPAGSLTLELEGHAREMISSWAVNWLGYSPDGKALASASEARTVRIWDTATGNCAQILRGHADRVWCSAFSPDGRKLASSGQDGTVRIWDVASGTCERTIENGQGASAVAYSPDGSQIAVGGPNGVVRFWDVAAGHYTRCWNAGRSVGVRLVKYVRSGDRMLVSRWVKPHTEYMSDGRIVDHTPPTIVIHDSGSGQILSVLEDGESRMPLGIISTDGDRVAAVNRGSSGVGFEAILWRRIRPEWWWGVFYLWHFWVIVVLGLALGLSIWKDVKDLPRARAG